MNIESNRAGHRKWSIIFQSTSGEYVIYQRETPLEGSAACRFVELKTGSTTLYLDRSAIQSAGEQITSIIINEITRSLLQRRDPRAKQSDG